MKPVLWATGVTTVPERRKKLLPDTLRSIEAAGFPTPWIFIDDGNEYTVGDARMKEGTTGSMFLSGLKFEGVTVRSPRVFAFGNWWLSILELYIRKPAADYYAVFQDDVVLCKNTRQYLEKTPWPSATGYYNLYTAGADQIGIETKQKGWIEAAELESGHRYLDLKEKRERMQQGGPGALALIFSREALLVLIKHQHFVERPMDVVRGRVGIDGGVVEAMNKAGWRCWVHNPSLAQHKGDVSTVSGVYHRPSLAFLGESFDALDLTKSS